MQVDLDLPRAVRHTDEVFLSLEADGRQAVVFFVVSGSDVRDIGYIRMEGISEFQKDIILTS
jgi:hypothetical protein